MAEVTHDIHRQPMHTYAANPGQLKRKGNIEFADGLRSGAIAQLSYSGSPAVIRLTSRRPVTLRPYLSIGLPFYRMLQLWIQSVVADIFIIRIINN